MNKSDHLWRIDSLEARAGLAFYSHRAPMFAEGDLSGVDLPGFFISAPDFTPELISTRALGLSAARHGMQEGLFAGETELGFPDQQSLVEFVRRCYVRGAGGDGADGGGGGPLPPPPPNDPPPEDRPPEFPRDRIDLEGSVIEALSKDAAGFADLSESLEVLEDGQVQTGDFPWLSGWAARDRRPEDIFRSAAEEVLFQLLPRIEQWHDARDYFRWTQALTGLNRASRFVGVDLDSPPTTERCEAILKANPKLARHWPELYKHHFRHFLYWDDPWGRHSRHFEDEPVDLLRRLPLPRDLRELVNPDAPDTAGLMDLLSFFIGSPTGMVRLRGDRREVALQLILFASAFLTKSDSNVPESMRRVSSPQLYDSYRHSQPIWALHRAASWLRAQMPKRAFPESLESMIGRTASLTRLKKRRRAVR